MNKHLITCVVLFFTALSIAFCDSYSEGEIYFRENRPSKAIPLFEKAIQEKTSNPSVYNLLGLSYYKLGKFQQAVDIFLSGTEQEDTNKSVLYYNAGNAAFAMGSFSIAEQNYTSSIFFDRTFAPSILNRANTRIKMNRLKEAEEDYRTYLNLMPDNPQKENIEKLISILNQELSNQNKDFMNQSYDEKKIHIKAEQIIIESDGQSYGNDGKRYNYGSGSDQRYGNEGSRYNYGSGQSYGNERERFLDNSNNSGNGENFSYESKNVNESGSNLERESKLKTGREKREKLLEQISASLEEADSENFSAGSEGVIEYEYNSELD